MPELARIMIRNFQSHANTTLEPAPAGQLTVIVGPSDVGKTAILRALRWLFYNRPQGDEFRRVGTEVVSVTVETADGHVVTRSRSSGTNRYFVDNVTLEGFGLDVPLEVQEATGVRTVRIAEQELEVNIARQLDPPFLGSGISGPARAKALGALAGVDVVDRASRALGTDLHRTRQEAKRLESEVQALQERLAEYEHLPKLAEALEDLKVISARAQAAQERREKLGDLAWRLEDIWGDMARESETIESLAPASALGPALLALEDDAERLDRLADLWRRLQEVQAGIRAAEQTLARTAGADRALAILGEAVQALDRLEQMSTAARRLQSLREQIATASALLNRLAPAVAVDLAAIESLEARLSQLTTLNQELGRIAWQSTGAQAEADQAAREEQAAAKEYQDALLAAGVCPVCGSPVTAEHLREVV